MTSFAFMPSGTQAGWLAASFSQAQVQVAPDQRGLLFAVWSLAPGQRLRISYLGLHFLKFATYGSAAARSELPLLYAGLYFKPSGQLDEVGGRPLLHVGLNGPGYQQADTALWNFTAPGNYCLRLVNNSATAEIVAAVTGAVKVEVL